MLDCYSIKPIDAEAVRAAARECGAIVTVEDHWPEGGLGDAVLEALADADERPQVVKLAVREMPVSGSPEELLHAAGIDAEAIAAAARAVVGARPSPLAFGLPGLGRQLLGGVDAAQERAARLARGLDLLAGQLRSADRAAALEGVLERALFEVHARM